jgi:hypothetical protein
VPNHKDSDGKGGHAAKEPYSASFQSIAHAIKELRDTIDASTRAEQTEKSQNKAKESTLTKFFQAWLPIIINALLLVVVVSQAAYAYRQWQEMRVAERAWITPSSTNFRYTKDKQGIERVESMIQFRNTGSTPAFNVHIWRCNKVLKSEPAIKNDLVGDSGCIDSDLGIMGTNIPISFETPDFTDVVPTDSLPMSVFTKGSHYYIWGVVTYITLSKDKTHFISFCLLNAATSLGPCSKGNDAD